MNLNTYSPSKIVAGNKCLKRLAFVMDGEPEDDAVIAQQGRFAHTVFERYAMHCDRIHVEGDAEIIGQITADEYKRDDHGLSLEAFDDVVSNVITPFANRMLFDKKIIDVEHRVAITRAGELCDWDDPDCMVRGVIDLIEDAGPGRVRITDYKTGFDTSVGDLQLQIYAWMTAQYMSHVQEIETRIIFVRWNVVKTKVYKRSDVDHADMLIKNKIAQFDAIPQDQWMPTPGAHCSTCQHALKCPHREARLVDGMINDRTEARCAIEDIAQLEARLKTHKAALRSYVERKGSGVKHAGMDWNLHAEGQPKPRSALALFAAIEAHAKETDTKFDKNALLELFTFPMTKKGKLMVGKDKDKHWPPHIEAILIENQSLKFKGKRYEVGIDISDEVDTETTEAVV